ncbi:MAG: dockerin type 1, partial [Calditrichaeota bacterium]|nr:dockerin type 1 [Calditrichota bacterium]
SGTNSDMTEGPVQSSSQYSVLLRTNQVISAGTLFHLEDASGNNLVTFAPTRQYYSIIFSSADLNTGTTYRVYTGGSSTGTLKDGVYTGGTYSGGTLRTSFTLSNIAQTVWF